MAKSWFGDGDLSLIAVAAEVLAVRAGDKKIQEILFHRERWRTLLIDLKLPKNPKRFNRVLRRMIKIAGELYLTDDSGGTIGTNVSAFRKYQNQLKKNIKNPTEWYAVHGVMWGCYNHYGVTGC